MGQRNIMAVFLKRSLDGQNVWTPRWSHPYSNHRIPPPFRTSSVITETAYDRNGIHEGGAMWIFPHFLKEPDNTALSYWVSSTENTTTQQENINNILSGTPLCTGILRNCWIHCKRRGWHYELQAARKFAHHSLHRETPGEIINMWTSLSRIETSEFVHRGITPLKPFFLRDLTGTPKIEPPCRISHATPLCFSICNEALTPVAWLPTLKSADGKDSR